MALADAAPAHGWDEDAPHLVEPPHERSIVVLAPHMDDETLGPGGTLARAVAENSAAVTVVFLTDGAKGYEPSDLAGHSLAAIKEFERGLTARRKEEARAACERLGFQEPLFLDGPDAFLCPTDELAGQVAEIVEARGAGAVFLPFFLDRHPDHRATNGVLAKAARLFRTVAPVCWGFEVWTPLVPNSLVDISGVAEAKRAAAELFESQNACRHYPAAMLGLNAYRSLLLGRGPTHAEAFVVAPLERYLALYAEHRGEHAE